MNHNRDKKNINKLLGI